MDFLQQYGISSTLFFVLIGFLAVILILLILLTVQASRISKLQKKYDDFLTGREGKSLEEILVRVVQDMDGVKRSNAMTEKKMEAVLKLHRDSYSKASIVRYDAFRGMTGKLSFVLGLLDGRNSGFLINCMHSNEGCFVYLKEVLNGESISVLSIEEKKALDEVLHSEKEE